MSDGLPNSAKIFKAFDEYPLTEKERPLIRTLHEHPNSTAAELSMFLELPTERSWNGKFQSICVKRKHMLGPGPQSKSNKSKAFVGGNIADYDGQRLSLRGEAADAFRRLGVI